MNPGRALDAMVAEKVMGLVPHAGCDLEPVEDEDEPFICYGNEAEGYGDLPHYSQEIADAWQVVERLRPEMGIVLGIYEDGSCRVETSRARLSYEPSNQVTIEATVPSAICHAALRAVGVVV